MIKSLHIENFRCFEKLDLEDLGLLNVVVGGNSSGKTALLEAIFLGAGGNPQVPFRFRAWRGYPIPSNPVQSRDYYESLWSDLFFRRSTHIPLTIQLEMDDQPSRALTIYYRKDQLPLFPPGKQPALRSQQHAIIPITFQTKIGAGEPVNNQPSVDANGFIYTAASSALPSCFLNSALNVTTDAGEPAAHFSSLSRQRKEGGLRAVLASVFPSLDNISVEITPEGTAALYCSVPGVDEKLPISYLSAGIYKLVVVLLAIAFIPGGIALIDEFENGFYYQVLAKVWSAVFRFCAESKVQLFVSTHSLECLTALLPTLQGNEDSIRLLRVETDDRNKHGVRVFKGRDFEAALETETEIR